MRQLTEYVRNIRAGNYGAHIHVKGSREMTQFALATENMVKQLLQTQQEVAGIAKELVTVHENDIRSIARDLHDEVGQELTVLGLLLDQALLKSGEREHYLHEARAQVSIIGAKIRNLLNELQPTILEDQGLVPSLLSLIRRYTENTGIIINFEQHGLEGPLPKDLTLSVYRIVQEALTNVARHAGVNDVAVRVWVSNSSIRLEIEDRGVGFDIAKVMPGIGISIMRARAIFVGGTLNVKSNPGYGTCISVDIPISES